MYELSNLMKLVDMYDYKYLFKKTMFCNKIRGALTLTIFSLFSLCFIAMYILDRSILFYVLLFIMLAFAKLYDFYLKRDYREIYATVPYNLKIIRRSHLGPKIHLIIRWIEEARKIPTD